MELLVPFIDQSPNFALGFECGTIWGKMEAQQPFDMLIHCENVEQVVGLCKSANYRFIPLSNDGHWCEARFEPAAEEFKFTKNME